MGALLAMATALLILLAGAMFAGAGTDAAIAHPDFASMQHGIDSGTLGAPIWSAYVVGLLVIGMMWVVMLIGFRDGHWIRIAVTIWTAWYVVAFVALLRSHRAYELGEISIVAGFTTPAAWLVYGIGLSPWILLIVCTLLFERAYFGPEEQARFDEILAGARGDAATHSSMGGHT